MKGLKTFAIQKFSGSKYSATEDYVSIEEPLQISIGINNGDPNLARKNIAVTMRTPGNDKALATGFLFTEGIINAKNQISSIKEKENTIHINLKDVDERQLSQLDRNFYTSSSCGVCGKVSIENIKPKIKLKHIKDVFQINDTSLSNIDHILDHHQKYFKQTGGIHASMLLDDQGEFVSLFEDVGRHNALDKLIGHHLLENSMELANCILVLSGRISFELVHKAAMAGIKIIVAYGAPSSLAIETAVAFEICLVGFFKNNSFNVYSASQRIKIIS